MSDKIDIEAILDNYKKGKYEIHNFHCIQDHILKPLQVHQLWFVGKDGELNNTVLEIIHTTQADQRKKYEPYYVFVHTKEESDFGYHHHKNQLEGETNKTIDKTILAYLSEILKYNVLYERNNI